jgi:hypothetical protein
MWTANQHVATLTYQYPLCLEENAGHTQFFKGGFKALPIYGFFRTYVKRVAYRYLDCGILHNGFARLAG